MTTNADTALLILLVDDEDNMRETLADILEVHAYEVDQAADQVEAFRGAEDRQAEDRQAEDRQGEDRRDEAVMTSVGAAVLATNRTIRTAGRKLPRSGR